MLYIGKDLFKSYGNTKCNTMLWCPHMWLDRRKRHTLTFKVDDIELEIINDISKALNVSMGEAIRRCLWVFRILYDQNLKVKDALRKNFDPNEPLYSALKPIPELAYLLGIEIKFWRRKSIRPSSP